LEEKNIPSEGVLKATLWLMLPQAVLPIYVSLIWLTPEQLRVYWVAIWFGVPVLLHIANPTAGVSLGGSDTPSKNNLQYVMKVLRSSILGWLPVAGIIFLIIQKIIN
jgi:hypothetical protein